MNQQTNPIADAQEALREYTISGVQEDAWRRRRQMAVVAYGAALRAIKEQHGGNDKAFGQAVKEHRLDCEKPFDLQIERTAAMSISTQCSGALGRIYAECPYSRPTHIMNWLREQGLIDFTPRPDPKPVITPKLSDAPSIRRKTTVPPPDGGGDKLVKRHFEKDNKRFASDPQLEHLQDLLGLGSYDKATSYMLHARDVLKVITRPPTPQETHDLLRALRLLTADVKAYTAGGLLEEPSTVVGTPNLHIVK